MKVKDLTGMVFGTLKVVRFDEERHQKDKELYKEGKLDRVRRHYWCQCVLCDELVSVRGENLTSGNTTGHGCNRSVKISEKLKKQNEFKYDVENDCYIIFASNTNRMYLIDTDDYELVRKHCWYETNYGYLMTRINKNKQIFLHRYLLFGENDNEFSILVDHKNRDTTDNRRRNLRESSFLENARNKGMMSTNTSGITGVSYYKPGNKWRAWVTVNKKFISLGYYNNKEDAFKARLAGEEKYYGEFAPNI